MTLLRLLAALLLRGENGEFIRHDLDELRERDRVRGLPAWRADLRYARALLASVTSLWRDDLEWLGQLRGGSFRQDVVFALRLFRKHPGPISIAIGGLALAIAVVTAVFSIVNATVLRPYAMVAPSSVVSINRPNHPAWIGWPYGTFRQMRDSTTLATLEAATPERVRFSTARESDGLTDRRMLVVSGGYLQMLGGRSAIGRSLLPSDDLTGAPAAIIVSYRFWQTALNSDPAVVGRTMWIDERAATLVGVMRSDFTGPVQEPIAIWGTLTAFKDTNTAPTTAGSAGPTVEVYGRLAPGVAIPALQQNLRAVLGLSDVPSTTSSHESGDHGLQVYSAASPSAGYGESDVRMGVTVVFTISLLVLTLACANTANLLMASAVTRAREVSVRLALGASRGRLIRQMLSESLLLASVAGALGFLLAFWLVPLFGASVALSPDANLTPDWRVLIFTIAMATACGIGAGLSPARLGARGNLLIARPSSTGSHARGGMSSRLRTSFITFQSAVSMLLLVLAALLTRSALKMTSADVGFDADRLLVVSLEPLQRDLDHVAYLRLATAAIRAIPSVENVSVTEYEPFGRSRAFARLEQNGRSYEVTTTYADSDYLSTAGLRILQGRALTSREVADEAPVAIISEELAHTFGPSGALGQSLSLAGVRDSESQPPVRVVGVVSNAMMQRPDRDRVGAIYRPLRHLPRQIFTGQGFSIPPSLIVRTATPGVTARAIENALRQVNAAMRPKTRIVRESLDDYLDAQQRMALLVSPIALLALALSGLGVYGVTSFVLSQRTTELGVRMAIGASAGDVLRMLLGESLRPVAIGLAMGLGLALAASQFFARELSGVSPHDPLAVTAAIAILVVGALVAVIMPARHAATMDPMSVLRES